MTEEEYNKIAGPCIADQFFHVFSESTLPVPDWIIEKNGSAENVAESVPFLAEDGSLWAMAKIYQLAGSELNVHPVPITDHEFTDAYLSHIQNNG